MSPTTMMLLIGAGALFAPVLKLGALQYAGFSALQAFQIMISIALLGASLFVILSGRYGPKDAHWAYGIIGTLVGFWFRGLSN